MKNTFLPFLLIFLFYSCTQDSEIESNQFNSSNITFPCGLDENGNVKQRIKCEPEDEVIKNNILTSLEFNNSFDWNSDLETAYGSPAFDLALVENGNNWTSLVLPVYRTSDRSISSIIRYYKTDTLNSYTFIDRKTNEWYLIDFNTFENKVNDFYFKLFDYGVCNSDIVPDYPDDDFEESLLCEADAGIYTWDPCMVLKNGNELDTRDPCDDWDFSEWQTVLVPCPPTSNGGGSGSGGSGSGSGGSGSGSGGSGSGSGGSGSGGGGGGDGDGGGGNNGTGGPNPGGGGNGSGSNGGWNTGGYNPTLITKAEAINNYQFLCSYLDNLTCSTMLNILQTESQSCYSKLQAAANFLKDKGYNNFAAQSSLICALNAVSTSSGNPNNPPCTGALSPPYDVAVQLNNRLFEHHNTFSNLESGVCSILNTNFTPQNRSELSDYVTNLIDQYITNNPSLPIGANNYLPQSIYDEINLAINVQSFRQFYDLNNITLTNLINIIPITCLQSSDFNECAKEKVFLNFSSVIPSTSSNADPILNCFAYSSTATYKITLFVDQPVNNEDEPYSIGNGAGSSTKKSGDNVDVGHTFIGFSQHLPNGTVYNTSIGFYPAHSIDPLNPQAEPLIVDDSEHYYDISITIDVPYNKFYSIASTLDAGGIGPYNLNSFNCTDYGRNAFNNAGILNLPPCVNTWPNGGGNNPGTLGQYLRGLQNSTGVTINKNGGFAPQKICN